MHWIAHEGPAPVRGRNLRVDEDAPRALIASGVFMAMLLVLALPLAASAASLTALAVVRAGGAEFSDTPAGKPLRTLATGTALDVPGRTADGRWLMTTVPDGATGWVPTARVVVFSVEHLPVTSDWQPQTVAAATQAQGAATSPRTQITGTVTTMSEALNVRTGPGTSYPVIGTKAPGAVLDVIGRHTDADWLQIALGGEDQIGWVAATYVRADGDPARLPVSDRVAAAPVQPASGVATGLSGKLVFQTTSGGTIYLYDSHHPRSARWPTAPTRPSARTARRSRSGDTLRVAASMACTWWTLPAASSTVCWPARRSCAAPPGALTAVRLPSAT